MAARCLYWRFLSHDIMAVLPVPIQNFPPFRFRFNMATFPVPVLLVPLQDGRISGSGSKMADFRFQNGRISGSGSKMAPLPVT